MTISQTLERDLFIERPCGNNVVKSFVYVEYCKKKMIKSNYTEEMQKEGKYLSLRRSCRKMRKL